MGAGVGPAWNGGRETRTRATRKPGINAMGGGGSQSSGASLG